MRRNGSDMGASYGKSVTRDNAAFNPGDTLEWFKTVGESVAIVTGLIFVICVLAFRRGIVGELAALIKKKQ